MEEAASWKSHGYTLLIFAGLVVLSAIFFVLGMLLGRSQGQRIASEQEALTRTAAAPAAGTADDFKLDFYRETTGDKQDLKLEPAPPPAPRAAAPDKTKPVEKPAKAREVYLQVGAFKTEKQAEEALKKVLAKGFKARLMKENNQLFRVLAGPYKESEVTLATKDLRAKGYKDVIRR